MRVLVTGLGIVSPLAIGAQATMDGLVRGDRAFGPISLFEVADQRSQWGAQVSGFTMNEVVPPDDGAAWSRTDAMAVIAAKEALAQSGLDPARTPFDLALGGTTGGMFETERLLAEMFEDPKRREPLALMLSHPLSATSDRLQSALGPFRRARTLCSACSGGANAIVTAAEWIRSGRSARVLAGGADGLCRLTFTGFNALGAIAPEACRPFDRRRAGLGLGEGAAFLVLESEEEVRRRGATPLAELAGFALGSEAHHITNPEPTGATAARLMNRALERAGVTAAELDYVNAHGTGTIQNDAMEAKALHLALGSEVHRVAVSSCKGQIGHTLGACGAIEAAITVLAIVRGEIPPTGGLEEIDPACELMHVRGVGRKATVRAALSNSFGFGGSDTVLLFTRPAPLARELLARESLTPALAREETAHGAPSRERNERPASSRARRLVVTAAATLGPAGLTGSKGLLAYLRAGPPPSEGSVTFDPHDHFDLARVRRLDRGARLLTLSMQVAMREARLGGGPAVGAIAGSAYGTVDASAEFVRRIYSKGAKLASPLVFPNLVPSSLVGHAAIYLGLRGPVFSVAELGLSGEAAFLAACELVEAGEVSAMLAASVEERSVLAEGVLGPVCSDSNHWTGARVEGSSAVIVEDESHARERGAPLLARVVSFHEGRGPFDAANLARPLGEGASVIVPRRDAATHRALAATSWNHARCIELAPRTGNHEGLGGWALACGAALVGSGEASEVLVLGIAPDRFSTVVLAGA